MTLGEYINRRVEKGSAFTGIEGSDVDCDLIQAAAFISEKDWNSRIASSLSVEDQTLLWLEGDKGEPSYIISSTL